MVVRALLTATLFLLGLAPVASADPICVADRCIGAHERFCDKLEQMVDSNCDDALQSLDMVGDLREHVESLATCLPPPGSLDSVTFLMCVANEVGFSYGPVCMEVEPSADDGGGTSTGTPEIYESPDPSVRIYNVRVLGVQVTVKLTLYLLNPSDCDEPELPVG